MNKSHCEKMTGGVIEKLDAGFVLSCYDVLIASEKKKIKDAAKDLHDQFWNQQRQKVLFRDKWRCTECGSFKQLDVHHKKQRSLGGTHAMENLITLCRTCHELEHS